MLKKKALSCCAIVKLHNQKHPWRQALALRHSSSVSTAVDSAILRSLKDHFLAATKSPPPPKMTPPEPFEVAKGDIPGNSLMLRRSFGNGEEIKVWAEKMDEIRSEEDEDEDEDENEDEDEEIHGGELLVHVEVSKAAEKDSLRFLCVLYSEAIGIDSVSIGPKAGAPAGSIKPYTGPAFRDLEEKTRDMFHKYIMERGVNESLYPFLQAWVYVNDLNKRVRWLKAVGTYIKGNKLSEGA